MAHYFYFEPTDSPDKLIAICDSWGVAGTHEMIQNVIASGLFRFDAEQNHFYVKSLTIADNNGGEIEIKPTPAYIGERLLVIWQLINKDSTEVVNRIVERITALPDDDKFDSAVTDIMDADSTYNMFLYILASPLEDENNLLIGGFDTMDVKSLHMHYKFDKRLATADGNKTYCNFIKFELLS